MKVQRAIEVLQSFEPPQGYYLAFSGGKDSQCIYHLAKMAGVKFDAHYNLTTVDPPELVWFIKKNYPDVHIHRPEKTMWQLIIEKRMPPTRLVRYCCEKLKEMGGRGRIVVTGVRWAESLRRKNQRSLIEANAYTTKKQSHDQDNAESRKALEVCPTKGKHILNPIIDWEDSDVWAFLWGFGIEVCGLYYQGYKRLGCVGCPMSHNAAKELENYPRIKNQYIRTFQRMVDKRVADGLKTSWLTGQQVYDWWVTGGRKKV